MHFIGSQKPWYYTYNKSIGIVTARETQQLERSFLNQWWKIFVEHVYETLGDDFVS